jgi:type II secretory pathway component PulJ
MLVSLLIFGIIASIATAMATGATRSFAASQAALGSVTALEDMRTILAADLGQAARRPSLAADGKPMPAFLLTPDGFVLTRFRAEGAVPEIEKVAWGFAEGRLLRQPFPAVDGSPPGEAVVMADGSDRPEDIVKFYRKLQEGHDCVFGSRFSKGGKVVDYPLFKLVL